MPHLIAFYRRVNPGGPGWSPVAAAAGAETTDRESLPRLWLDWAAGCILVYGILFGIGAFLFGSPARAGATLFGALLAGAWLYRGPDDSPMGDRRLVDLPRPRKTGNQLP